ncbi:hypothetical protein Tco_1200354 [Tanacetum coccineum]
MVEGRLLSRIKEEAHLCNTLPLSSASLCPLEGTLLETAFELDCSLVVRGRGERGVARVVGYEGVKWTEERAYFPLGRINVEVTG